MENSQDVDVSIRFHEVGNAVVAVKKDTNGLPTLFGISVAHFRKSTQQLGLPVDAADYLRGSLWIIFGNIVMNILKPTFSFFRPV